MSDFSIRNATPDDAETVFRLVQQLAEYEKLSHQVISSPEVFSRVLARPESPVEVLLAESGGRLDSLSSLRTFRLFLAGRDYISKTSLSCRRCAGTASLRRSLNVFFRLREKETTAGWSGRCWIGTHRRSTSTRKS